MRKHKYDNVVMDNQEKKEQKVDDIRTAVNLMMNDPEKHEPSDDIVELEDEEPIDFDRDIMAKYGDKTIDELVKEVERVDKEGIAKVESVKSEIPGEPLNIESDSEEVKDAVVKPAAVAYNDGLEVGTFGNHNNQNDFIADAVKDTDEEGADSSEPENEPVEEEHAEPIERSGGAIDFSDDEDDSVEDRASGKKLNSLAIIGALAVLALLIGLVFGAIKFLSGGRNNSNGDTGTDKVAETTVEPTALPVETAVPAEETAKPESTVDTTPKPEATETLDEEKPEATADSETDDEEKDEEEKKEDEEPQYALGEGPQGTAGRVYFADGSSAAVDWQGSGAGNSVTAYHTDALTTVITGTKYEPVVGKTMAMSDEYGYAYTYQCTSIYSTYIQDGVVYLSDGTPLNQANYGNLAINSNGTVSFWNIVG